MDRFFRFLNSDRYQYAESEIYLKNNMHSQNAVFDVFLRTRKENDYAVVYGISDVLEMIDVVNETSYEDRKKYLSGILDNPDLIEYISDMKFTGSIRGVRDGEIVFSDEPVLTVTAPLIQGKILETPILNLLNYQMLTATAASKIVQAAKGKEVLFFGTRRSPGFEAAMSMTKACFVTGCTSHSNLMGEYLYSLKSTGTMTHGFVQSFGMDKDSEYRAFDRFIKTYGGKKYPLIMLIDTYDTIKSGITAAIRSFRDNKIDDNYEGIYGIRIDSGNLEELAEKCRRILNENRFYKAKIILTGSLDEKRIKELIEKKAEVDIFGVGDAIALPEKEINTVYKMSKIGKDDVMKISDEERKMSLPGSKVLYRIYENDDFSDVIMLEKEKLEKKNARKLTIDYIKCGEKIKENCQLLNLQESKKYYDSNLAYLQKIYSQKEKRNRVNLSENLKNLKKNLIERKKS